MAPIAGNDPIPPVGRRDAGGGARVAIPYVRQESAWTCGAASLGMVYRSLGADYSQAEIWSAIAAPGPLDSSGVALHRLGRDALERGFAAVVVQAADPWAAVVACDRGGVRVIVNQPLTRGSPRRHYAVLAGVAGDGVTLHDPTHGPDQRFAKDDWLGLWGTRAGNPEARINAFVAIGRPDPAPSTCPDCTATFPGAVPCPGCSRAIPLRPAAALGCPGRSCRSRLWRRLYCPHCDRTLTTLDADRPPGAPPLEDEMAEFDDIQRLAKAVDHYQRKLSATKGFVADAGLRDQLGALQDQLKGSFEGFADNLAKMNGLMDEQSRQAEARQAAAQVRAEAIARTRAEAVAQLAAKQAEKAARLRASRAKDEVDPHLGAKLRDTLLEEFGTRPEPAPRAAGDYGSLFDYRPEG